MKTKIVVGENDIMEGDINSLNILLKQLNSKAPDLIREDVQKVMQAGTIITLRDASKDNVLVGVGILVPIRKLFSFCGSIEDVVVLENYRGQGLGKEIIGTLLEKGKILGMKFVDLTSHPDRKAANKLYESMSFTPRKTNNYRFYF